MLNKLLSSCLMFAAVSMIVGCGDDGTNPNPTPPERKPSFLFTKVGNPTFEIVDPHRFTTYLTPDKMDYTPLIDTLKGLMPTPNHVWRDDLGVAPGMAHAGPYRDELSEGLAKLSLVDADEFAPVDVMAPNGVITAVMVVPSAGAPTGKSPDSDNGPFIPHTIFPIGVETKYYINGVEDPSTEGGFFVSALSELMTMPYAVDGHSHFPLFFDEFHSGDKVTGEHVRNVAIRDSNNNGWDIASTFVVK